MAFPLPSRHSQKWRPLNCPKPLSIIVPVYNGAETLTDCLQAICGQDYSEEYEVLVVDDGSTDATPAIVASHPVKSLRLPANQGRLAARAHGANLALNDLLLFVDSRVILPPDFLARLNSLNQVPLMAADDPLKPEAGFWQSALFILRRYFYKPYYPQSSELLITPENFARAPKGATCLLIKKETFLNALPPVIHRHSHDDSALLAQVVALTPIHRRADLGVSYLPRQRTWSFLRHLFWRGPRFADYYLAAGGRFYRTCIAVCLAAAAALVLNVIFPWLIPFSVLALAGGYFVAVKRLTADLREFAVLALALPPMAIAFGAGIIYGKILAFTPQSLQ